MATNKEFDFDYVKANHYCFKAAFLTATFHNFL